MPSLGQLCAFTLLGLSAIFADATSINDFSCKRDSNPVYWLQNQGYCTYAKTYGTYEDFPFLGGLKPINESAFEIAAYIKEVIQKTGKSKVDLDLVGHSKETFQSLYAPKFEGVANLINKIASIAPPTHSTTFAGIYELAYVFGNASRSVVADVLDTVGCEPCNDLGPDGPAAQRPNNGNTIVQPGNSVMIIASKDDELDKCPLDPMGHIGEAYDVYVWNLVKNVLDSTPNSEFVCLIGSPGK